MRAEQTAKRGLSYRFLNWNRQEMLGQGHRVKRQRWAYLGSVVDNLLVFGLFRRLLRRIGVWNARRIRCQEITKGEEALQALRVVSSYLRSSGCEI